MAKAQLLSDEQDAPDATHKHSVYPTQSHAHQHTHTKDKPTLEELEFSLFPFFPL